MLGVDDLLTGDIIRRETSARLNRRSPDTVCGEWPLTKRGTLLLLDSFMLAFFAVLMSWRLTGVVLHEWIGMALIAMILVHLVVHWGWVEARVAAMLRPAPRRFGALLLNTAVFAAMGTTIISGLVVSKVIFPNRLSAATYLHWHGVHESAATLTVLLLGLHLAFNWDRITGSIRRAFAPAAVTARSGLRSLTPRGSLLVRRLGWILVACAMLSGVVWSLVRLTPANQQVMFVYADGRRELVAPPPELAELHRGTEWPAAAGAPRFVMSLVLLVVSATVGRQLLTIRRRRRKLRPRPASAAAFDISSQEAS